MKIKITYIFSNINKALAFEWLASYIDKGRFDPSFILLNEGETDFELFLHRNNLKYTRIKYSGKKDIPFTILKIYNILKRTQPDIVHTHLFDASFAGMIASKMAGIQKRIYTRHHSDSNKNYVPRAVKYDKLINMLATHIVAVSRNVADYLKSAESVPENKITIIHHGLNIQETRNIQSHRIIKLRSEYINSNMKSPVIGVISRYIHLKGIQYIIPAFKKLLETYPDAYLILANAKGNYSEEIKRLLSELPPNSFREIIFEEDLFALYHLFDLYVHTPIDATCEAFGQTYIEALACGVPSIFTLSGVAKEFIKDGENALVVNYKDSEAIFEKMIVLLQDESLRKKLAANGIADVEARFSFQKTIDKHEQLYLS